MSFCRQFMLRLRRMRVLWSPLLMVAAAASLPLPLAAQDFPSRPVTFVIPFPVGGSTDVLGRLLFVSGRAVEAIALLSPLALLAIGPIAVRMRRAIAREKKRNSFLPDNIDELIFGYFDTLEDNRERTAKPASDPSAA